MEPLRSPMPSLSSQGDCWVSWYAYPTGGQATGTDHASKAERDPRFVRTGTYLTAQLLQAIQGFSSGSKRLYELSESSRSTLINNARNMGLFEMHRFADRVNTDPDAPEDRWEAWIHTERLRRLTCALYVRVRKYTASLADTSLEGPRRF